MADQLPINFAIPAESAISSYNWTDFLTSRGYVSFYPFSAYDNTGTLVYSLTTETPLSKEIETTTTGDQITLTRTFNSEELKAPLVIEGTALISFSWRKTTTHVNDSFDFSVYIQHYDGTTATTLGSIVQKASPKVTEVVSECLMLALTKKDFSIGDQLRVVIILRQSVNTGTGGKLLVLGHDPVDRDGTYIIPSTSVHHTQSKISIPFKIDL